MNSLTLRLLLALLLPLAATAQEKLLFTEDFTAFPTSQEPDLFILAGTFTVEAEDGGNHVLQIATGELVDATVQLGDSLKTGGEIVARVKGVQQRRSFPRFGVGLHGKAGFQLRVSPAARAVELLKGEEVIQTVPFSWAAGQWHLVRLRVAAIPNGGWSVSGWVWPEAAHAPTQALIDYISEPGPLQGKASLFGTPFSGQPIQFDDVRVTTLDSPQNAAKPQS
ncbi:MAG: hypothetical protein DVB23_001912 [Verrucomicrobia bacterium]|nr:MAG: hypothetical protein DVB23_001912 [Verrucomicrobiota bacterium]